MHTNENDLEESCDPFVKQLDRLWGNDLSVDTSDVGRRIGPYELLEVGGAGSFGIVYRAHDVELNRIVALKIPRMETLLNPEKRRRFALEAETAAKLSHPGIVQVYQAVLHGTTPYIASQWCDGPDLSEWLEQGSNRTWKQSALIMAEIADAVAYAHRNGVCHRDLKPANILMSPDPSGNSIRLTDFGLAKIADSSNIDSRSSLMLGTPLYMAPEQLNHGSEPHLPPAIDIYSLGVILFEMLTGELPVNGSSYVEVLDNVRNKKPLRLRELDSALPKSIDTICAKCLQRDPADRYSSADDLANDLRSCVADQPIRGQQPGLLKRFSSWCTRPARVANAGWFAVVSHLLISTWLIGSVVLAGIKFGMTAEQWSSQINSVLFGVCFSSFPVVVIGVAILHRIRAALAIGLIVSFVKVGFMTQAIIGNPLVYGGLYQDGRVFSFMDLVSMWGVLVALLFLLVCAFFADRKHQICGVNQS